LEDFSHHAYIHPISFDNCDNRMNIRNKFAIVAAAVAVTTLAMTVVPALMTSASSTTTIVQSAWAQEVPGTDTDTNNLIEQYNVPNASDLVEEHKPLSSISSPAVYRFPEVGIILHGDNSIR
jgi:hypothetical protein